MPSEGMCSSWSFCPSSSSVDISPSMTRNGSPGMCSQTRRPNDAASACTAWRTDLGSALGRRAMLRFRGREMAHQEFGMRLLERVKGDLDAYGVVEQFPKMEGRQMVMVLAPAKKK